MRKLPLAGLVVIGACTGGAGSAPSVPAPMTRSSVIDVQGHRGARGLVPENTLVGFRRAIELGVTTLELDVGMTADGVLVVHHDARLNPELTRDAGGEWIEDPVPLRKLTLSKLRELDVGRLRPNTGYATRFPHQTPHDGAGIPTLEEVLVEAEKLTKGRIRYNIETKLEPEQPGLTASPDLMVEALLQAIERHGVAARTTVQSFDWRSLRIVHAKAPHVATVCLTTEDSEGDTLQRGKPGASPWLAGLDADDYPHTAELVVAAPCRVWSPRFQDIREEDVAIAHSKRVKVIPWTVNELHDIRAVIDLGVDGVISDYPDRAMVVARQRRGRETPSPRGK